MNKPCDFCGVTRDDQHDLNVCYNAMTLMVDIHRVLGRPYTPIRTRALSAESRMEALFEMCRDMNTKHAAARLMDVMRTEIR